MTSRIRPKGWWKPSLSTSTGWLGYSVAAATTLGAGGLYVLLEPLLQPAMFLLLTPAVVFSAWFGGRGPAILASVLSIAVANYLYYAPIGYFSVSYVSDAIELGIFLGLAFLVASTMESLRYAWARAEAENAEAEAAVRARDEVLAIVSHDLRNLVGTAQTAAVAALEMEMGQEGRGRELVRRAIRLLAEGDRLINDLLDVSQSEKGRLELRRRETAMDTLVAGAVAAFEEQARARGIELSVAADAGLPPVLVDPDRLVRACYNLLGNAVHHCPPGSRVDVSIGHAPSGGEIIVSVADTGPGVRDEDQPRLFEPFWRGAGGTGAGLGLAIAKVLVEAHGGRIWVESAPGRGSTFRFSVPAGAAGHAEPSSGPPPPHPGGAAGISAMSVH